jgi:putative methyltransferase (TIGR04325 family)
MAAAGRRLNPSVQWHTDDSCLDGEYDVVIFSSVLPYIEGWEPLLARAARAARRNVLVTRVPTLEVAASYVAIQEYFGAAMFHRQTNRGEMLRAAADAGLVPVREFYLGPHLEIPGAPEQPSYRGWLFEPRPAS